MAANNDIKILIEEVKQLRTEVSELKEEVSNSAFDDKLIESRFQDIGAIIQKTSADNSTFTGRG